MIFFIFENYIYCYMFNSKKQIYLKIIFILKENFIIIINVKLELFVKKKVIIKKIDNKSKM